MKTTTFVLILFLTGLDLWAQTTPTNNVRRLPTRIRATTTNAAVPAALPVVPRLAAPAALPAPTVPAPAVPAPADTGVETTTTSTTTTTAGKNNPPEEIIPAGNINFQGVSVDQVLEVYAQLVGRTLLRSSLPQAMITLKTQTPLTKTEAIQALQAVLSLNNIAVVNVGEKFVKVLPNDQAGGAGAELSNVEASQLPSLGGYITHIVQLKYIKPSEMVPIITPFAKLANSILPIDANGILVLRDNAENVKRMLELINQIDVSVPAEYISEVIPIKYALAEDIANALNSLGGTGGSSTVSIGASAATPTTGNGVRSPGGGAANYPAGGNNTPNRAFGGGAATPNGTPNGGSSFQQRIQSILSRAASSGGQQDQIQVFGQAKIIADQRANALLIFATQADMTRIKEVVAKLDVLLSQVLIEAIIMDVSLNSGLNLGVSVAQNPKTLSPSSGITTAGGANNGQPFFNFLNSVSNAFPGNFTDTLPGGAGQSFSYFGSIGPTWDVALQAAANDSTVSVVQRPRIQTSQAKAASFFVGSTVPYITGTSYGSGFNGGNSSTYSQLSVGVQLDVTPFINPDGLVVMDINQEIDDLNGSTTIDGNAVPNTVKRTISSEIAVKDRDTIILGGFIKTDKLKSKSGIPLLMDIPILGNLFRSSTDTKDRQELIVLMRPTVLRTPELAAAQAVAEQKRLPGISAAAAQDEIDEQKQIEAQNKLEQKRLKALRAANPSFNQNTTGNTNSISPDGGWQGLK